MWKERRGSIAIRTHLPDGEDRTGRDLIVLEDMVDEWTTFDREQERRKALISSNVKFFKSREGGDL